MPEEGSEAPAAEQDTSHDAPVETGDANEAPEASQEDTNWEQRYSDLRSEFDRRNPGYQLIEALQDPRTRDDAFARLAEELGYELEGDEEEYEDEDDEEDEEEFRDPRVDHLLSEREQELRERYLDDLESYIDSEAVKLAKSAGIDELTDRQMNVIYSLVEIDADGVPDVAEAFKELTGLRDDAIKSYRASKRDAPSPPVKGSAGERQGIDYTDGKARRQRALEIANRSFASGG
jgi:hypothetical protein